MWSDLEFKEIKSMTDEEIWRGHQSADTPALFDYRDEAERRGFKQLMRNLGWPVSPESIYMNRYTADKETLQEMFDSDIHNDWFKNIDDWISQEGWGILEHWLPEEIWEDSSYFPEHNPKQKLTHYFK